MPFPLLSFVKKLRDVWGREADQDDWFFGQLIPPQENPDDTTADEHYDFSYNPQCVAGMAYSDVCHLFVSARGLQDNKIGATFPPQLMWTTPELGNQEILDCVGWQFDEEIEGGFAEVIRSTDNPCKSYGYNILEYEWYIKETNPFKGKAFVKRVYARDQSKYMFDYKGKPGIYQNTSLGVWKRMSDQTFQSYSYNPLYNNPYGTSINFPLKRWLESFVRMFGYWEHALQKAGMGSWIAHGNDAWFIGKNNVHGQQQIAKIITALKSIAAGTYSVFPKGAEVDNKKLQLEAQAFLDWYTAFCEVVSLIYTGTTGALKEEEYGARAAKESTDVREKSQKEKFNAMRVSSFWTYKFIPLFCAINFRPSRITSTPTLQLIPPNLMMPTTPKDQDTADEVIDQQEKQEKIEITSKKKQEETSEMMGNPEWWTYTPNGEHYPTLDNPFFSWEEKKKFLAQLQKEEDKKPYTPPVAVPATYQDFPQTDPLSSDYREIIGLAQSYLESMSVKAYTTVIPEESHRIFTVKRLRGFGDKDLEIEQQEILLKELKLAIIPTLDAKTEDTAWKLYWQEALKIFQNYGFEQPSPQLRNSLIISFRQARQNALNEGYYQQALQDPTVVGLRIVNNPHVKQHHFSHTLWNGIAIPKEHPELQLGGRLRIPMDFGCVCRYDKVFLAYELTPESEWPEVYPGETYKFYAQPTPQTEENE